MENVEQLQESKSRQAMLVWSLIWIGLIALLVIVGVGLRRTNEGPVVRGETAPDFSFTSFEGEDWSLSDFEGKVVLLNFWASWCKPCEQEAADLQTAWELYEPRGDVIFLGLDYVDTEPEALAYLEKFRITYPNGPDLGQEIYTRYRAGGVPETYLIDRSGKLAYIKIGPFQSLTEITAAIEPLLQE